MSINATKETDVIIKLIPRKYPFHLSDRELFLKFLIENNGPGYALNVQVELTEIQGFTQGTTSILLGNIPKSSLEIRFNGTTLSTASDESSSSVLGRLFRLFRLSHLLPVNDESSPSVLVEWQWDTFKQQDYSRKEKFKLEAQKTDIDWDNLKNKNPYPAGVIESEKDLVGRDDMINDLYRKSTAESISTCIYGQKRVGKTSIAKTLKKKIEKEEPNHIVVFESVSNLDTTTGQNCVTDLGTKILNKVLSQSKLKIEPPKIDSVLAPLGQVFDQIRHRRPSIKMTIIIDEFDEIPRDLYPGQSPTSDTFLNNIRGLNDKEHVCFVLVGGEKMQQFQGQKFNSFDFSAVDYLDKDQYWDDFQSLVQKPVEDIIEYEIAAIEALYEVTEGNPFFTNRLCRKIYLDVCKSRNRDAYITKKYVKKMIINSLTSTFNKAKMSHFWEDGISVYDSKSKNSIQTLRIRVLRAFADLSRRQKPVTKDSLKSTNILQQYDGNTIDKIIDSFVSRKIFVEENSHYRCKPLLLEKWLVETGGYDMDDPDVATLEILNDQKNEAYVTDKKISQLTEKWGDYGGKEIKVRPWLNQFEDNNQQRLMFKLLENLEFYNEILFRRKLRVINEYVLSSIKEKSSSNILVSCFDPLPKAGPSITRLYKIENGIDGKNVCELRDIPSILMKQNQIKAVVFVDDLIGSGQTMVKNIDKMNEICGEVFENNNALNVFITTVCGLESGIDLARRSLESLHYTVTPYVPDDLTKCFSDSSSIFASESERHEAKKIAGKYGVKLLPDQPLGFNDGQLLLTFPHNCPNNSLPILWSNKNEWLPLFERY